jgi:chorismate synthase
MSLRFLTSGESHGPALLVILDGMPAGLALSQEIIDRQLLRRQQGYGAGPRMKLESDTARILGGVMEGQTTGAPLALQIENHDHAKWRGKTLEAFPVPRPGHADLTGAIKYGYNDLRPALERASARETAARVAMGAICKHFLGQFGIIVGGYVTGIGEIAAEVEPIPLLERFAMAEESEVRCPDRQASQQILERIRRVMGEKDTLGGVIETIAVGLPPGLGSFAQWDRRMEARIGAALLSIQAIKGVEIGPAFENAAMTGTQVQDGIALDGEKLVRTSNRAGGLEGGVTNGEPLVVRAAMKPIATTLLPQRSVNLALGQETGTHYERSDFCPVPRAVPILEGMLAFVLADALIEKLGGDSLGEMQPRCAALRSASLADLHIEDRPHVYWPEDGS